LSLTESLEGVGILRCHAEGSLVVVVDLVDVFVEAFVVCESVDPVVPRVLYDSTQEDTTTNVIPG